ncbi:MAG: DUF1249 domain-containing protein [Gammaproteobacteria bacterium]|nr:DUF1249 domain-containing protein [Gammaproteobacteria bacterium]
MKCAFREKPDALFEELYGLLALLLPELASGAARPPVGFDMEFLEHSRYTTTLRIRHHFDQDELVPDISMTVRIYHDARVAEVIAYQGCERLPAPYAVNGDPRYVRDERRQINRLLRQFLRHRVVTRPVCLPWRTPDAV